VALNPLLASLTLLGLYFLGRVWLGESWALLAVALLAANPMANEHALFGDAHTSLTFFLVWGLFLLVRWGQTGSLLTGMMAGCRLGLPGTIRYPEVLLTGAAAIYALWLSRTQSLPRRSLAVVGLGMVLPLAFVAVRNQAAFGAFWKTGYGLMAEPELFAWRFLASHWADYVQQLLVLIVELGVVSQAARWNTLWAHWCNRQ
jgi:4-amino-4-deoxy-L-arabinose transferase-like glycosyltransferase